MKKSKVGLLGGIGIGLLTTMSIAIAAGGSGSPIAPQVTPVVDSVPQVETTSDIPNISSTAVATTSISTVSAVPAKGLSSKKIVAPQPIAPKDAPINECNPNYSGCLKINAGDYDCAGGSGNGPNYTGPVQVLGVDEYGLDRDHDGMACE